MDYFSRKSNTSPNQIYLFKMNILITYIQFCNRNIYHLNPLPVSYNYIIHLTAMQTILAWDFWSFSSYSQVPYHVSNYCTIPVWLLLAVSQAGLDRLIQNLFEFIYLHEFLLVYLIEFIKILYDQFINYFKFIFINYP